MNKAKPIWTCIAVTCSSALWAETIQYELELLKKNGIIHSDTILTVIEDPAPGIGSGGATVNALLVIAEKLSAQFEYSVISSEVLTNSRILILHHGRLYPFDPCSKALMMLPGKCDKSEYGSFMKTNIQHIIESVEQLQIGSNGGLWVCSTDMIIEMSDSERLKFDDDSSGGIMVCVPAKCDYAVHHGTLTIDQQQNVQKILYGLSQEELENYADENHEIPLISGIVYLSPSVAEVLLSFHELSPLDCCTYMGIDSGASFLQVSLFFDILLSMSSGITKEDFMSGNCGKLYNKKFLYKYSTEEEMLMKIGRNKVWDLLSKFRLKAGLLKTGRHKYLSEEQSAKCHYDIVKSIFASGFYHTVCEANIGSDNIIVNSNIQETCAIRDNNIIEHSNLRGCIEIGSTCFVSSVQLNSSTTDCFHLSSNMCWISFPVNIPPNKNHNCHFVFGINDNLHAPLSSATFCNESFKQFLDNSVIPQDSLWPQHFLENQRTIYNASLYPVQFDSAVFAWFQGSPKSEDVLNRWKTAPRVSIKDIITNMVPTNALQQRKDQYAELSCQIIRLVLLENKDVCLIPYFKLSYSQQWSHQVLKSLDEIAVEVGKNLHNHANIKRVLFCIADVLGCMGGNQAGIRSGPAGNKNWDSAFASLKAGNISVAVGLMAEMRKQWMNKPELLLRAARHYEKAALIIIHMNIGSAVHMINLSEVPKVDIGVWVLSECPARVDIMGGWTDTPPQCYELMGSVVGVSFKLFGKKPIGAKGQRIQKKHLKLVLHAEGGFYKEMEITTIEGVLDYCRPNSFAALLKSAIVVTGIVDVHSSDCLEAQLGRSLGSGLELHTWADVPQGSGLGTSSILAGAVCSTLWTLAGKSFSRNHLIHAVLHVEQLMTTGGGWQDGAAGITGGICNGKSKFGLPIHVTVDRIHVSPEDIHVFNQHFVIIYTGKVRLARNILQNTIRNWYSRQDLLLYSFKEMLGSIEPAINAIKTCDIEKLGKLLSYYWQLKKGVASGCEPASIRQMMNILEPHIYGQTLAGAGGGGFLCIITKQPNNAQFIQQLLIENEFPNAKVYESCLDMDGIELKIGDMSVDIPHLSSLK